MHFILVFNATAGDAIPVVALADRLQQRGHDVVVLGNGAYRSLADQVAVEYVDIVSVEENERRTIERNGTDKDRAQGGLRNFITDLEPVHREITARLRPGQTVVAAHGLCLGARVAQELHHFPMATLNTTTSMFFSASDPDGWHRDTPRWLRRPADYLMRKAMDWLLGKGVDRYRAQFGLKPMSSNQRQWSTSPDCVIGLFPDWFAPVQPEWPSVTELVGFPLININETPPLSQEIQNFLNDGPPPLVCSHSSAFSSMTMFFREVVDIARQLRQRAILLASRDLITFDLPDNVRVFPTASHLRIYPHAGVAVNHAGMGSASAGLIAGVPQFHAPFAYDQPEVAHRCQRLGVSRYLKPGQFTAKKAIPLFEELLHNPAIKTRCRDVAQFDHGYDGINGACAVLERLGKERLS